MIITDRKKTDKSRDRVIDLTGPKGNAFSLLGIACSLSDQLMWSDKKKQEIVKEMRSKNYKHLLDTFDLYFGDFIDLYATEDYFNNNCSK